MTNSSDQERARRDILVAYDHTFGEVNDYAEPVLSDLKRKVAYGNDQLPKDTTGKVDSIQMAYILGARSVVDHILQRAAEAAAHNDQE